MGTRQKLPLKINRLTLFNKALGVWLSLGTFLIPQLAQAQLLTNLDWNVETWPPGSRERTFSGLGCLQDTDVTIAVTEQPQGSNILLSDYPVDEARFNGNKGANVEALILRMDTSNTNQTTTTTITLSKPTRLVSFPIFDVDVGGSNPNAWNWQDRITITGFDGAAPSVPTLSTDPDFTVTNPTFNIADNRATGNANATNTGSGAERGTVVAEFPNLVDRIQIIYGNGPQARQDPAEQSIGLYNIEFNDCADLTINKTDSSDPISVGTNFNYTLTVTNNGPGRANEVVVTDTLPEGSTFIDAEGDGWTCEEDNGVVTCTRSSLAPDANSDIIITVRAPNQPGEIANNATVSSDTPDPDENNNRDRETTTVTNENPPPAMGVAKQVSDITPIGSGRFRITYDLVVQNLSENLRLNNIQLTEDLAEIFGAGNFTVASVTSPTLTTNNNYNGNSNTNLLAGTDSLEAGARANLRLVIEVTPPDLNRDYENQVEGNGTSPNGTPVSDRSDNGDEPDPNGNGNANEDGENDPTPIRFPVSDDEPAIGVVKHVASFTSNGPNSFNVTYQLLVENLGNVDLRNVQLVESLDSTFNEGNFTVTSVTSPTLTTNNNFDGSTDLNLLAGTDTLAVGQTASVELVIQVTPEELDRNYQNQVTANGTSPNGTTVNDLSDNDVQIDPNGNGNANEDEEDDPTPINFSEMPVIGVAKNATTITPLGSGRFRVNYGLVIQNLGNVNLNNVQLVENLNNTFGAGNFTVTSVTSPTLRTNNNFDGDTDINLLAGTDTLAVDQSANVELVIEVTPTQLDRDYENQVAATGTSPKGVTVNDLSDNGVQSDSNNNGNAEDDGEDDPTVINFTQQQANLRLVKRITSITRDDRPIPGVNFNRFFNDPNDDNDNAFPANQRPVGITQLESGETLESGDEVQYTIYFLSDGNQPVTNVRVCDPIPPETSFIPNSFGSGQGILVNQGGEDTTQTNRGDGDQGRFFSPLAPLNNVNPPCPNPQEPKGAVFVELGDVPNTAPDNVGFVRFWVKVD